MAAAGLPEGAVMPAVQLDGAGMMPLGGPDGRPVHLEDVFTSPRVAALAELMNGS